MSSTKRRALLTLEKITKFFESGHTSIQALREIDLQVYSGEFLALMGKSGSGKSTLLHLMGGLDLPSSGRVFWKDQDLQAMNSTALARWRGKNIGFVFQAYHLVPTLTAQENVELPLLLAGSARQARKARARDLLAQVELDERAGHKPPELSGGEQQRVALARALAADPELILADEPTGNLDLESAKIILDLLAGLHEMGKTLVLATHDAEGARRAERQLHLKDGQLQSDAGPT